MMKCQKIDIKSAGKWINIQTKRKKTTNKKSKIGTGTSLEKGEMSFLG